MMSSLPSSSRLVGSGALLFRFLAYWLLISTLLNVLLLVGVTARTSLIGGSAVTAKHRWTISGVAMVIAAYLVFAR